MSATCDNACERLPEAPRAHLNRPGLDRIDYSIGCYAELRDLLLHRLDLDQALAGYSHRDADDPGIALLECAAILGDILGFYQERYANEAYLRTATWRESVAELVRLLGYRLRPGLGGRALLAVAAKGDKPVQVPMGFPLKMELSGSSRPVEMETTTAITAYPWLSRFQLYRPLHMDAGITADTTAFYVDQPPPEAPPLKVGDRLLVGVLDDAAAPTRLDDAELLIVDAVSHLHGIKEYRIKGRLTRNLGRASLVALKLGRSFRHFGHNSPLERVVPTADGSLLRKVDFFRNLTVTTSSQWADGTADYERRVEPALDADQVPLDRPVDDLAAGGWLLLQADLGGRDETSAQVTLLRDVTAVQAASMTWGVVSGASTLVKLSASLAATLSGTAYHQADIRRIQVHEVQGPLISIRPVPREQVTPASGKTLYFFGTAEQAATLSGRSLMLVAAGGDPRTLSVASVDTPPLLAGSGRALYPLTLSQDVAYADFPHRVTDGTDFPITVYGNLVVADQGRQEREAVLGNGDARQSFQTFKLPKAPLTWHLAPTLTPPYAPALEVRVDGRLYTRVPTLFGQAPTAQVYIVREDAEGNSWVQLGDGKTGARLPSGVGNVKARYRSGSGAHGSLKTDTKVQTGRSLEGLTGVDLPGTVTGGEPPETAAKAREAGPARTLGLGRLVSLADIEAEALALPGVARAAADWSLLDQGTAVLVTVLMEQGRQAELAAIQESLRRADRCRGMQRHPLLARLGERLWCRLWAQVALDPTRVQSEVLAAVRGALGVDTAETGLFSVQQRRFGEPEHASRIEAVIQGVTGVLWTRVVVFGPVPGDERKTRVDCAEDQILALAEDDLSLQPIMPPTVGECPDD